MARGRPQRSREKPAHGHRPSPKARRRTLRFVGLFGLILIASNVAYYQWIVGSRFFELYLSWSAAVARKGLDLVDLETGYRDGLLTGPFLMSIRAGCDGIQAFAVLVAATLAFPVRLRARLAGILVGAVVIFVLNAARLASLYWLGARQSSWFQAAHVHLWPAALILAMGALWLGWAAIVEPARGPSRA